MIIKGNKKYINELSLLWKEVFKDSDEFINIFFKKQYGRCETFCFMADGKIVSAFYLLPCQIICDTKAYHGRYLYAAATKPEYRGKKLMSRLICEAQEFCKKQNIDFIVLVPAENSLYRYYERFGFRNGMYRHETAVLSNDAAETEASAIKELDTADELKCYRDIFDGNRLTFDVDELDFVIKSMKIYGSQFLKDGNCYAVINKDENEIYEFIGEDITKIDNFACLMNDGFRIYSPYDLSSYGGTEKKKFGMIYPINESLKACSEIYMNLGLD